MPIVASILVNVAIKMVEFEHITHMWSHDKKVTHLSFIAESFH